MQPPSRQRKARGQLSERLRIKIDPAEGLLRLERAPPPPKAVAEQQRYEQNGHANGKAKPPRQG